jgi:hypothetical protein
LPCLTDERRRGMQRIVLLLSSIVAALLLASWVGLLSAVKPAEATFPGLNGKIAFASISDIYTINPDGTDRTQITTASPDIAASNPSFSPNGDRIVYFGDKDMWGPGIYSVSSAGALKL